MGLQTQWSSPDTVFEAVDAGFNMVAIEYMVRNYSYTGLAMLRCLHDVRYFCGVSVTPKMQRTLIEGFFNECLQVRSP